MRALEYTLCAVRRNRALILLLTAIGAFYACTIRSGNSWGDDFALYIHHAKNIATGVPYAETGYIYNVSVPKYGPPSYPPVFPLLLAPIYCVFGLSLWAMKFQQVVFFVVALLLVYGWLRRCTTRLNALAVVTIVGFNPNFWAAKDGVLSDLPFLLFFWLAAWLMSKTECRNWKWGIVLGSVFYVAVGTRTIGITIVCGFLLYECFKQRRLTASAALPVIICLGALAVQTCLLRSSGEGGYLDLFHPTVQSVVMNVEAYARTLASFWMSGSRSALAFAVLLLTTLFAVVGGWHHLKRGPEVLETSLLLYMGAVMIWPGTPGIRFLYPLLPFYVYLVVAGLSHVTVNRARNFRQAALAALLLIIGASYLQVYRATSLSAIPETDGLASFTDMCARVSTLTNNNDVFLCRRPRALTLFAGRRAAVYQTGSDGAIWEFVRQKQVGYLLCNRREPQDVAFLLPFIARYRSNLDLIYRNEDFEVYGTRPDRPRVTASNPQPRAFPHP